MPSSALAPDAASAPAAAPPSPPTAIDAAWKAVAAPARAFRDAVVAAAQEVRAMLGPVPAASDGKDSLASTSTSTSTLGAFGAGRIDLDRFASLAGKPRSVEAPARARLTAALQVLESIAAREPRDLFHATVPAGHRLGDAVSAALSSLGRAFGAARVAGLLRAGRAEGATREDGLRSFPHALWNRRERRVAPPVVVEVAGADLRAGDLAEFLDGTQKIVLVVRGDGAPAPLVRLVTPGTFVLQTVDGTGLDRFAAAGGPAVAAIFPDAREDVARFVHDPAFGPAPWQRFAIAALPKDPPRHGLSGWSAEQQADEVRHLVACAERPPQGCASHAPAGPGAAPGAPPPASDPARKLAAWLLSNVHLDDPV